jgi:hypothetical protein
MPYSILIIERPLCYVDLGIGLDYNIAMNTEEFTLEGILNDNLKEFSAKI